MGFANFLIFSSGIIRLWIQHIMMENPDIIHIYSCIYIYIYKDRALFHNERPNKSRGHLKKELERNLKNQKREELEVSPPPALPLALSLSITVHV